MENIKYLVSESNLFIRPPKSLKYSLEVSTNTNHWERLSWKTAYSMILAFRVSSQLFGCGRVKLGLLGWGHLHHLMFSIFSYMSTSVRISFLVFKLCHFKVQRALRKERALRLIFISAWLKEGLLFLFFEIWILKFHKLYTY